MNFLNRMTSGRADDSTPGSPTRWQAVWKDTVLADSDATIVVDGNHYFPPDSVNWELLQASDKRTVCPWKGQAGYHTIAVDGDRNEAAAWVYSQPKPAAADLKDRVAFWRGVKVRPVGSAT